MKGAPERAHPCRTPGGRWLEGRRRVLAVALLLGWILPVALTAQGHPPRSADLADDADVPARIVTLGGSVTETVFALGAGDRIVAVDASSNHPARVRELPQVGYFRTLSVEGVLSLDPDVVLASSQSGPPVVLEQLRQAGVEVVVVPDDPRPEGALEKVAVIAAALGLEDEGLRLASAVRGDIDAALALVEATTRRPRALFVWGRSAGSANVGGAGTGAGAMLELAGAENAGAGLEGYRPITSEAVIVAAPEVLVVPSSSVEAMGGLDAIFDLPGISATPAGEARRVILVDLLAFLGFGPRTGQALADLARQLHPALPGTR
jgi:iron complex transport system substrate-binding protein